MLQLVDIARQQYSERLLSAHCSEQSAVEKHAKDSSIAGVLDEVCDLSADSSDDSSNEEVLGTESCDYSLNVSANEFVPAHSLNVNAAIFTPSLPPLNNQDTLCTGQC